MNNSATKFSYYKWVCVISSIVTGDNDFKESVNVSTRFNIDFDVDFNVSAKCMPVTLISIKSLLCV